MPESQQPDGGVDIVLNKILETPNINVIDVGAGEGKWGKLLKDKVNIVNGIEVWEPYITKYNLTPLYDTLHNVNMMDFKYEDEKYDVMILGDVLEHLKYEEAIKFIENAKQHVHTIYLIIPISLCVQDGTVYGNPFETHLYQWKDEELKELFDFKLIHEGHNPNGLVKIGTYVWEGRTD